MYLFERDFGGGLLGLEMIVRMSENTLVGETSLSHPSLPLLRLHHRNQWGS